ARSPSHHRATRLARSTSPTQPSAQRGRSQRRDVLTPHRQFVQRLVGLRTPRARSLPTPAAPCGCNRRPNRSRCVRLLPLLVSTAVCLEGFHLPNLRDVADGATGRSTQELRPLDKDGALQTLSVRGTFALNTFDSVC